MLGDVQFSGLFPFSTFKKATRSTGGILIRSLKLDGFKLSVILSFNLIIIEIDDDKFLISYGFCGCQPLILIAVALSVAEICKPHEKLAGPSQTLPISENRHLLSIVISCRTKLSPSSLFGPSYVLAFYREICQIGSFFSLRLHFSGSKTRL